MMGTQSTGSAPLSGARILCIACFLTAPAAYSSSQTETKGHELTEVDEDYVGASGTLTRCGKYFLLETKTYGALEVQRLHFSYTIDEDGVAMASKNYRDLDVVIDDTKSTPTLMLKWENPDLEKDRLELSGALYEETKTCVPPPKGDDGT